MAPEWNPSLYEHRHAYVWEYGRDLVQLLAPQPGERILDVGCGTGQLTEEIARAGARVSGVDSSANMIEEARRNFPDVHFELADARSLGCVEEFDAVFSNAALHWVRDAEAAAGGIARALKPKGRFVAEFGGKGNVQSLLDAAARAFDTLVMPQPVKPWYFPSIAEYAPILEHHGLEVAFAVLFDRPTPLQNGAHGLEDWIAMFGSVWTSGLASGQRSAFLQLLVEYAAPKLFRDGQWHMDYRRLRIVARRR